MVVNQVDGNKLDIDLDDQLWSLLSTKLKPSSHTSEIRFLLSALTFYLSTTSDNINTLTYGSSLTGTCYKTTKRTLFIANVLSPFLLQKFQTYVYNSGASFLKVYNLLHKIATVWSLTTFLKLISGNNPPFLSLLHKLLRIQAIPYTNSDFYQNSVNASIEFQNTQLLYNALLQLLNTHIIGSSLLKFLTKRQSGQTKHQKQTIQIRNCPQCNEIPTIPYKTSCCATIMCYYCLIKCIASKECSGCEAQKFQAIPIYNTTPQEKTKNLEIM